jgi:hypothetical protein
MQYLRKLEVGGEPLRDLVGRVLAGDGAAWKRLWAASERLLLAIAGSRRSTGPLGADVDERHEIPLRVMGRIHAHGFRALRRFADTWGGDEPALRRWLAKMARREAAGHVRAHAHYLGRSSPFGCWVRLSPIVTDPTAPDVDVGAMLDLARILRGAPQVLDGAQLDALRLWMEGESPAEIAAALGLADEVAAQSVVDAAIKRLKRGALRPPAKATWSSSEQNNRPWPRRKSGKRASCKG